MYVHQVTESRAASPSLRNDHKCFYSAVMSTPLDSGRPLLTTISYGRRFTQDLCRHAAQTVGSSRRLTGGRVTHRASERRERDKKSREKQMHVAKNSDG